RVRIYKKNYTLTDIYYEPGYHLAKLIANDSIIKTIDINIPTKGWFLFAQEGPPHSVPEYIEPTLPMVRNGSFLLDKKDLAVNKIDASREKRYVYCIYPRDINVSSDNYILKTRAK